MAALGSEDWCNPSHGGVFSGGDRQCTELPLLRLPRLVPEVVGCDPFVPRDLARAGVRARVRVRVRVCVRACVRACVRGCGCARVRVCGGVRACVGGCGCAGGGAWGSAMAPSPSGHASALQPVRRRPLAARRRESP